ncbi:MAG: FliI/YscN family ATPase [Myxococcales bacterium]|nr:FliI/YscN family ATPase [Myxococcales bacterium]
MDLTALRAALDEAPVRRVTGRLVQAVGPLLEAELPGAMLGSVWRVEPKAVCEVVGFRERRALLMPLEDTEGVTFGAPVTHLTDTLTVSVGPELLGRVVDGLGRAIDGRPLPATSIRRKVSGSAPPPLQRALITEPLATGVRVIDGLCTLGIGQRMSIMAGSGVGKSTLLGAIARNVRVDANVICLVGERGREVREFLETNLGEEGLKRSVLVVATSEQSPAQQVKAPFLATTIAEALRDAGMNVLLMVDSLTRLALAQRQIGLAAGEPPTTRGFTPSVFGLMPKLLERAGPGANGKSITGLYTVLVEGDDINDPIGDAVRGIVDGHLVLTRKLASHNHYPAVDVLESLSRLMPRVTDDKHRSAAGRCRDLLATWAENEELVRLGAYRKGSSPQVDEAIDRMPHLLRFLQQGGEGTSFDETLRQLDAAIGAKPPHGRPTLRPVQR